MAGDAVKELGSVHCGALAERRIFGDLSMNAELGTSVRTEPAFGLSMIQASTFAR